MVLVMLPLGAWTQAYIDDLPLQLQTTQAVEEALISSDSIAHTSFKPFLRNATETDSLAP
ncbi:MAG: hypothetical protein HRT74_01070 [Flavobacteriales bacterium]|nr:hypothetical protein [Flavobacteriales bacterium]